MSDRPRVLFVGRTRYRLPLPAWLAQKWDAVGATLDLRVLASGEPGTADDPRFRLLPPARPRRLDGALFYARLPGRVRRELEDFRPDVVVAADPFVGAAVLAGRRLARSDAKIVVEVHGDWRTFARLYGSPARRLVAPLAEAVARASLRRADATRALSGFTSSLVRDVRGVPASATFPTFSDLSAFTRGPVAPLPERPTALFVGALEPYKNVAGLAEAWPQVERRVPGARLLVVGKGSRQATIDALLRDCPGSVEHVRELEPEELARRFDEATVLVLPSWPEGLGRVIIEAFARGRGVVATAAGGVLDLVTDGEQGLLVPRADTGALVEALTRVLTDRELADRLGRAAHARYAAWDQSPQDFARAQRELVDRVLAGEAR